GSARQPRLPPAARGRAARAAGDDPPYLSPPAAPRRRRRALPLRAKEVRRGAPAAVRGGARRRGAPPPPPLEPARYPHDRTPRSGAVRRARLHAREPLPGRDPGPRRPALRAPGRIIRSRAGSPRSRVLHRLRGRRRTPASGPAPAASPDRIGGRWAGRRAALPRRRRGPRAALAARAPADDGGGRPVPSRDRLAGAPAGGARGGGARAAAVGPRPRSGALRRRGVGQPVRLQHGARHRAGARTRAGRAVQRAGQGRAVGPGPTARAARSGARARTRTARRADARRRGAHAARLSAVAARARPRRGAAHGRPPGQDAQRCGSRARAGRRRGGRALRRIGLLTGSIADLASVRTFLRRWCATEVALDRLEVSHLTVGPDGPRTALYEGPGPGGQVLRLVAQRVESAEGRRLEAELNRDYRRSGAPAAAGFVQPAIYAPELHLLFQVFPADGRLGALAQAADGSAMAAVLEAALAARTGGARLAGVAVHVVRYKPARKCLFRYELTWAGGAAASRPAVVYAKVARRSKFERTRHILGRICAAADGLVFELPEPLGFVPELCMELFS